MSGTLLLFPAWGERPGGWLRFGEHGTTRGIGLVGAPAPEPDEGTVLVAPGDAVALHMLDLPPLAPNQARAAARLAAADVIAQPLDTLHVALGEGGPERAMAIVDTGALADWLAQARAIGLDPDRAVPEPYLLPAPDDGEVHWPREGATVVRAAGGGHMVEPGLAMLLAQGPVRVVDDATVEAGLADVLSAAPVDLRQGVFAKRRRWRIDWALVRRLALIATLILGVTLALQATRIARYELAGSRADARAEAAARRVLPRATRIVDPIAQLESRVAELRGGGLGFSTTAVLVFDAVRAGGGLELTTLGFDPGGQLTATVYAGSEAEIADLATRLERSGLRVTMTQARAAGGRRAADLVVTTQ